MQSAQFRERILADPDVVLDDREVMKALISANRASLGENIVDLRGIALTRLEERLERLEDTHRSVIAAAYENLAGTNQVHRAVLTTLDAIEFEDFLLSLSDVAEIMNIDMVRLVLESNETQELAAFGEKFSDLVSIAPRGFVSDYLTGGRDMPERSVLLRQVRPDNSAIYGEHTEWVRSEACLRLDFGPGKLPGMLVFGSEDPHKFKPTHGTDLLAFFGGVFERAMRRWLA